MHQKGEIALKNEIVRKLTSRKLWAALIAVAATFSTAIFKEQLDTETVELIGKGVVALACTSSARASPMPRERYSER
jgi:hypothetical protein